MELVLLCLSLLVQHGLAQEPCKCLDQRLCEDPAGCGYRCRAGFAGKYCSQVNLGFNISFDAPEIFDGDFSTCRNYGKSRRRITFKHSIDIDKIRIHRKNNDRGKFYVFVYESGNLISIWNMPQYKMSTEGAAAVASFPLQTGVTAIRIDSMGTACEVVLTNEQALPQRETPTPSPAPVCNPDTCNQHGTCKNVGKRAVCHCKPGYTGERCATGCDSGHYGLRCQQRCSSGCSRNTCDHETGTCPCKAKWRGHKCEECRKSYYGDGCGTRCPRNCKGRECNNVDGTCMCKPGWTGNDCEKKCPDGTYGQDCVQECSGRCQDVCKSVDGSCTCTPGWKGKDCSQVCSRGRYGLECSQYCRTNCKDQECNHVDGSCLCKPGWIGTRCSQRCPSGTYGQNCSSSCSQGCQYKRCDRETGTCTYRDCEAGWTNSDNNGRCDRKRCSSGCAGLCDSNGRCDRCKPGWSHSDATNPICDKMCDHGHYGPGCQQSCSSGCSGNTCDIVTGRCSCKSGWTVEKSNHGYPGTNCRKCSEGCADICNKANGDCSCKAGWTGTDCSRECRPGHYGPRCQQNCSSGCLTNTCHHVTGWCSCTAGWTGELCDDCEDGHYGQDCLECSEGCGNICNKVNGYCTCKAGWTGTDCSQECSAGWYGPNCKTRCNEGCQTEHCNHVTGHCNSPCRDGWTGRRCKKKCGPGRYGPQCRLYCRRQCVNCDHVSGSCGHNCTSGWFGEECTQNCPAGKYGQGCKSKCNEGCDPHKCDPATGNCTGHCKEGWTGHNCKHECPSQHYGKNCVHNCSVGCEGNVCDRSTGTCQQCISGWKHRGDKFRCDQECENGTFGAGCGEKCSQYCKNASCHHVHGSCPHGCIDGWTGARCQESSAQSSMVYVAIVLVVLILVLFIVLIVVFRKKIRKSRPAVKVTKSRDIELPLALREPEVGEDDADLVENEYANQPVPVSSTSVPLSELKAYVASKRENKDTLMNEYIKLPQGLTAAHNISLTAENNPKNRFRGVYPYNHSLVPLKTAQGRPTYINASFIDGLTRTNQYIATQGPLPDTVNDLWEMIWQHNIPVIVMLANFMEDGKRRCEPYWPVEEDPTVMTFGHISVSVADEHHYADYTVRTLRFSKGRLTRTVKHVHYTVWPDKGVPADTLSLVALRQKVRSLYDYDLGPLLVHCSAGIGRTGTLIALDYLMEQADTQNRVDIFGCVWILRGYRFKMVQTEIQYVFLHDCILDAVEYTQTPTPDALFVDACKRLNRESGSEQSPNLAFNFKRLQDIPVPASTTRAAKDQNNIDKNRSKDILPGDLHRPYLMKPVPGRTDYINAVVTSSYKRRHALILTQSPLKSTVVDFWRLIRDHHIERIVLLDNFSESDEDCGVFWPEGNQRCHFGPISISKGKFEQHNGFSMETLEYQESSPDVSENKTNTESVTLFRCTFWAQNQSLPESDSRMLCFLDFLRQWDSDTAAPLVVVCRDGCTRSGLFCVLSNVLERLIVEKEVAINNAIRRLRLVRRQVVPSLEQYKFLHEAVSTYILNFHDFSNA